MNERYGMDCIGQEKVVDPKLRMTFEIGKRLEEIIVSILADEYWSEIQGAVTCEEYPLFQGSFDLLLFDPDSKHDVLVEIKTANDSSFNTFKKKGLRLWYPEYYDQIQSYMGMSGVHKCYLLALNKNTSELHDELVLFDAPRYEWLVAKARRIGEAVIEPPRINGSASYFRCRMCFYKRICHEMVSDQKI